MIGCGDGGWQKQYFETDGVTLGMSHREVASTIFGQIAIRQYDR